MKGEGIISIELAVGAATFVLGARLFSLIQATRGVHDAHSQILEALSAGDARLLEKRAQGLGYTTPYADLASRLIEASQREGLSPDERSIVVDRSAKASRRRFIRRTQQGQALDLVALAVATGLIAFAREGLPAGPLFWSLAGAVMILLVSSLVARAQLKASVLSSLELLRNTLQTRPQLPSLSEGPVDCLWCGARTESLAYELRERGAHQVLHIVASVCGECGKLVANLPSDDDADSNVSAAEHPLP